VGPAHDIIESLTLRWSLIVSAIQDSWAYGGSGTRQPPRPAPYGSVTCHRRGRTPSSSTGQAGAFQHLGHVPISPHFESLIPQRLSLCLEVGSSGTDQPHSPASGTGRAVECSRDVAVSARESYAQLKSPVRVRDMSSGELRYRWLETGGLDHYRHAQVFDHLVGIRPSPGAVVLI